MTNFGDGIDDTVVALGNGYNERGLLIRATSYGVEDAVLNEVAWAYNDFNQPVTEYQEHSGAVDPESSASVGYSYEDASDDSNTIRPTGLTYPSSTAITTGYVSDMANALSRPDQISDGSGTIASWAYLGLGTVVMQNYDAADDSYLTMQNGSTGDAGDKYTGLNRFGWLVETIWKHSSDDLVHSSYGRNRVGGVVWRRDDKAHAMSVSTEDNYYWYDSLQQVTQHERGDLTPSGGPPYTGIHAGTRQQQEAFSFDQTGNWLAYTSADPSLDQTRTQNKANEIASLTNPEGVIQPTYDSAGNMTTTPQPADWASGYDLTWDAWNRLKQVNEGETMVTAYAYDARTRQITQAIGESNIRAYYYDRNWRNLETWVSDSPSASYVWNPTDRWTLIRRDSTYVLKDYLDPVAIINSDADVLERYGYDVFGPVTFMDADFSTISVSAYNWNFLFHAEFMESDTGLYDYGYRYYQPQLGRWISRDPIGEEGGFNFYEFGGNNPISALDFLGLATTPGVDGPPSGVYSTDWGCCVKSLTVTWKSFDATKGQHEFEVQSVFGAEGETGTNIDGKKICCSPKMCDQTQWVRGQGSWLKRSDGSLIGNFKIPVPTSNMMLDPVIWQSDGYKNDTAQDDARPDLTRITYTDRPGGTMTRAATSQSTTYFMKIEFLIDVRDIGSGKIVAKNNST